MSQPPTFHADRATVSVGGIKLCDVVNVTIETPKLSWRDLPRVYFPKGTSRRKRRGVQAVVDGLVREIYQREGILLRATKNTGRLMVLHAPELAVPVEVSWNNPPPDELFVRVPESIPAEFTAHREALEAEIARGLGVPPEKLL